MRAARISHVRSACEVGIGCARARPITKPDNYDWKSMAEIKLLEDDRSGLSADDLDPDELVKAKKWIAKAGWGFTLLIVVIWPVLSTPAGVFTKDYFAFWIFIAVIWALVASFIIIALPIWESKDQILAVVDGIFHTNLCEYYNPVRDPCPVNRSSSVSSRRAARAGDVEAAQAPHGRRGGRAGQGRRAGLLGRPASRPRSRRARGGVARGTRCAHTVHYPHPHAPIARLRG